MKARYVHALSVARARSAGNDVCRVVDHLRRHDQHDRSRDRAIRLAVWQVEETRY
jgi:hypothetical protein